jgi:hypothetical protein
MANAGGSHVKSTLNAKGATLSPSARTVEYPSHPPFAISATVALSSDSR